MATLQEQMDAAVHALEASNSAMATDLLAISNKCDAQTAQIAELQAQIAARALTQASLDLVTAAAAAAQANTDKAAALATALAAPPVAAP